ncbi:MAG: large conductance mechanosensitive channel protein MscL [Alphaproteobacteria bacterium]|nr:large conductance mechanosensitive channel protein MscL [Alphaproteobacteria bacterium]
MLKEFRDFALKGNVLDLAIGVIMATTFGGVVASAVKDVIMPIVGMIFGHPTFDDLALGSVAYGKFLTQVVNFLIVAFSLFIIIKAINTATGGGMKGEVNEEMKDGLKDSLKEQKE